MTWIMLEGLDATGKSSVAEIYRKKGFEIIHLSAPDKKYKQPGYAGPSYCDDILDLLMKHDGVDTLWDRTWMGEAIWPHVYGREAQLSEDDVEMLREFEDRNAAERILMIDPDPISHWARCVANKEPLNQNQFRMANTLFNKMAHKYGFQPKQLSDYVNIQAEDSKQDSSAIKQETVDNLRKLEIVNPMSTSSSSSKDSKNTEETELEKLAKANAIKDVISKRLVKQKGGAFDKLEEDIKGFLKNQLSDIFSEKSFKVSLSEEEITVLKIFCQRFKEKETKNDQKK